MDNNPNPKQQIVDRLKESANILVTVSKNPSVDQLASAIGLTLFLNKLGKHGTAVFSGKVPSTIEFLQPEKTLETNTDSLRDFIIALDKSKADKLRYKVDGDHVKIFITPYRTSISEKDLEFSQGDFNVDVVVALGVQDPKDLDEAITAHGRILHDATVVALTTTAGGNLGSLNWVEPNASSLSEMAVTISEQLKQDGFDAQIATAFLTGVVAETARFSNEKTTPLTMTISSKLMAAGANQQLIATELQPKPAPPPPVLQAPNQPADASAALAQPQVPPKPSDGSLLISHDQPEDQAAEEPEQKLEQIHIDEDGQLHPLAEEGGQSGSPAPLMNSAQAESSGSPNNSFVLNPPSMGGTLTANSRPEDLMSPPSTDPLSLPPVNSTPLLSHEKSRGSYLKPEDEPQPGQPPVPAGPEEPGMPAVELEPSSPSVPEAPPPVPTAPQEQAPPQSEPEQEAPGQTLADLETAVDSPHAQTEEETSEAVPAPSESPVSDLDTARDAVSEAISANQQNEPLPQPEAFNSQVLDLDVQGNNPEQDQANMPGSDLPAGIGFPPGLVTPSQPTDTTAAPVLDPLAPPPVPPPMMPQMQDMGLPPVQGGSTPPSDNGDQAQQLPPINPTMPPPTSPQNPFNLPPA